MTEAERRERLHAATEAARAAAAALRSFRTDAAVRTKAFNDFVTEADLAAQQAAEQVLRRAFPRDLFLGEEEQAGHGLDAKFAQPTWVVDPLDGTTNFIHGLPTYVVSVGLVADHQPQVGVILDPNRDELFSGARGFGAESNGVTLQDSGVTTHADALLATGFPASRANQEHLLAAWKWFAPRTHGLRRTGSTAHNLAHVAAGHFDAYYAHHVGAWDVAAGLLLVAEAGGCYTTRAGQPYRIGSDDLLLVSNGHLHEPLLAAFAELP
ncbi:MAG TPA: inositol monophosphatase family protein [Gemmatales bacterium]|nr:inositol monophosphatase family protein [Gemmatales bacterium]